MAWDCLAGLLTRLRVEDLVKYLAKCLTGLAAYLEEPLRPFGVQPTHLCVCGLVSLENDCRIDDFHLHQEARIGALLSVW